MRDSPAGPAPHGKESLPPDSFTRTALVAKLPKVNANLIAKGALVYSFLQGKNKLLAKALLKGHHRPGVAINKNQDRSYTLIRHHQKSAQTSHWDRSSSTARQEWGSQPGGSKGRARAWEEEGAELALAPAMPGLCS